MTRAHPHEDTFDEFALELRALAETLLERIEPTLRRAAADGREWDACSWCPVCAAAALVRGEHHEVLTAVADHGTAIVTVLREALAGVPVEPLIPDDPADPAGSANPDEAAGPASRGTGAPDHAASNSEANSRAADAGPIAPDPTPATDTADAGDDARMTGTRARAAEGPGRHRSKHAGRDRDPVPERPGYVPIRVRIRK